MKLHHAIPEGAVVFLDTAPFIYYIESNEQFLPVSRALIVDYIGTGRNTAITSVITLAEVLVQPKRQGRIDLEARYREFLGSGPNLSLLRLSVAVAEKAAEVRASYGIRLPDAFQLAAALTGGATHFATNDSALKRVPDLKVVVLGDLTV